MYKVLSLCVVSASWTDSERSGGLVVAYYYYYIYTIIYYICNRLYIIIYVYSNKQSVQLADTTQNESTLYMGLQNRLYKRP